MQNDYDGTVYQNTFSIVNDTILGLTRCFWDCVDNIIDHCKHGITCCKSLVNGIFYSNEHTVRYSLENKFSEYYANRCQQVYPNYNFIKQFFLEYDVPVPKPQPNHTHGQDACTRSYATRLIKDVISFRGLDLHSEQMSKSDQNNEIMGTRTHYWAKDTKIDHAHSELNEKSGIMMIDVDYYIDMNKYLAHIPFVPVILYTLQPGKVSRKRAKSNYHYYFENNTIHYFVNGGGKYVHKVWNYQQDFITVHKNIFHTRVYEIIKRKIDCDHYAILLMPITDTNSLLLPFTNPFILQSTPLKRFEIQHQCDDLKINILHRVTNPPTTSIGIAGQLISVKTSTENYNSLINMTENLSSKVGSSSVATIINELNINEWQTMATILRKMNKELRPDRIFPIEKVQHFNYLAPTMETPKESVEAFMNPLINPSYAPMRSRQNDLQTVNGRVAKFLKGAKGAPKVIKDAIIAYTKEIASQLKEKLIPADIDFIYEKQNKPAQTTLVKNSEYEKDVKATSCFQKSEAYGKVTDPRNITTFCARTKRRASQYMYPFAEFLKTQKWYAFGRTPKELSKAVAALAQLAKIMNDSDGKRWDGHVDYLLRLLDVNVLVACYGPDYADDIVDMLSKTYNNVGYTKEGIDFFQLFSHGSGDVWTSCLNGLRNHFIGFLANYFDTQIFDYNYKAMVGGDDSITFDITRESLIKAAKMLGQDFDVTTVHRGTGFSFLSRQFHPNVWFGSEVSWCDIKRTCAKFNVTPRLPPGVTPTIKLIEKARAYYKTDRNTPIIGPLVQAVHRLTNGFKETGYAEIESFDATKIQSFFSQYDEEVQFDNNIDDDTLSSLNAEIATWFDVVAYETYLELATSLDQILEIEQFSYLENPHPTIPNVDVNGKHANIKIEDIATAVQYANPIEVKEAVKENITATPWITQSKMIYAPPSVVNRDDNTYSVPRKIPNLTKEPDGFTQNTNLNNIPTMKPKKAADKMIYFNRCIESLGEDVKEITKTGLVILDIGAGDCNFLDQVASKFSYARPVVYTLDPAYTKIQRKYIYRHIYDSRLSHVEHDIRLAIMSSVIHHMSDKHLNYILGQLKDSQVKFIYVRDHDVNAKDVPRVQTLKEKHDEWNDTTPTFYRERIHIIKLFNKYGYGLRSSAQLPRNQNRCFIYNHLFVRKEQQQQ